MVPVDPATDMPPLNRDRKVTVQTVDTVYVFTVELDLREKLQKASNKDGSPLAKNPLLDLRVRQAIDLAIDRKALAEFAKVQLSEPDAVTSRCGVARSCPSLLGGTPPGGGRSSLPVT